MSAPVTHSSCLSLEQDNTSLSSSSSSPPQFPTDLSDPIPEESDEETESVSHNEPVTPVSGRQSSDFPTVRNRDHDNISEVAPFPPLQSDSPKANVDLRKGPFADFGFPPEPPITGISRVNTRPTTSTNRSISTKPLSSPSTARDSSEEQDPPTPNQDRRRSTRGSSSSGFKRTMSNLFSAKRKDDRSEAQPVMVVAQQNPSDPNRRWSMARSSATTPGGNTPPSPTGPIFGEASLAKQQSKNLLAPPGPPEMLSKKNRASTGFSFKDRAVNFATGGRNADKRPGRRRASSFDNGKRPQATEPHGMARQDLYMAAEAGVGVKARRLSLSLPDDITIDIGDLNNEFESQHKFFGRHRDHLGKGATARVRIMARKGFPGELYAVKEFRGKNSQETKEEYDKKVKSEYSIAKSLHHPNIIETIRLCVDHGRWNHVMEYCSEGDLFSLIKKGHLKTEDKAADRLCIFKQLIQGLNYLHANGIAHRDIKLENLLITKDSKLKITDFGVSEVFSGIHPGARESGGECGRQMGEIRLCNPGVCGSEPYIAPEVLAKDRKYDPRALDVWSAGIVMIALYCGSTLWEKAKYDDPRSQHYTALVKSFDKWNAKHPDGNAVITESDYPHYPIFDTFFNPPALRRVLLMMLNPNPDKRAAISDIVKHRWVKNIECCQAESYDDPAVVIDATKSSSLNTKGTRKIFCHNHLPPQAHNTHSLGKMPGQAGY